MRINKDAGEVGFNLGDRVVTLRPSFSAIADTEAKTNKSIMELVTEAVQSKIKISDAVAILYCCFQAAYELQKNELSGAESGVLGSMDYEKFSKMAFSQGAVAINAAAQECLINAIIGGKSHEAESSKKKEKGKAETA